MKLETEKIKLKNSQGKIKLEQRKIIPQHP
jgi:hypothetical protein